MKIWEKLLGKWEDERSVEKIIEDIYAHRTSGRKEEEGAVAVSFMTAAELYYGAAKSNRATHNNAIVDEFLLTVNIIYSDNLITRIYG